MRRPGTGSLALAVDMFRVGVALKEAQLRREFPRLRTKAIVAQLKAWLLDKPPPGGEGLREIAWPPSKKSSAVRSRSR